MMTPRRAIEIYGTKEMLGYIELARMRPCGLTGFEMRLIDYVQHLIWC